LVFPTFCRGRVQGRPCPNVAISEIAPLRARDILRLGVAEARNLVALDTLALNAANGLIVNVMSGGGSIVPNLQSSAMLSVAATLVTLVLAIPAAYALARLRMPAKKPVGFYVLARQMLPPIRACDPVFSNLQPVQPAQHLFRADRGLRVVVAALRDLADGFLFRGDSPRDGRGRTDRPRHPAQGAVACDPAAGEIETGAGRVKSARGASRRPIVPSLLRRSGGSASAAPSGASRRP